MAHVTLTEFLLARIAEEEAEANQYILLPGATTGGHFWGEHGRWFPARVLAECEAKRAIVKQAKEASSDRAGVISEFCVGQAERDAAYATDPGDLILKALALPYAANPDYLPEWKP